MIWHALAVPKTSKHVLTSKRPRKLDDSQNSTTCNYLISRNLYTSQISNTKTYKRRHEYLYL